MKKIIKILLVCLLCFCLNACGAKDEEDFIGIWDSSQAETSSMQNRSGPSVLVEIKRSTDNVEFNITSFIRIQKVQQDTDIEDVAMIADQKAVFENGRLKLNSGAFAEIDSKTGQLRLDGLVLKKTEGKKLRII